MTIQYSDTVRDAKNDVVETTIGTSPKLQMRTGAKPANCAAADTGVLIAEMALPSDWMNASAAGVKTKLGVWSVAAVAAGVLGHYRIKNTAGTVTHEQGSLTITGGGGDMTADNDNVAIGQTVTVTSYQKTSGNA
jgi:hypothetical protein